MTLRHCHVCGPTAKHGALFMHRLDGYMSTYDRVVWLCGLHWAEAQKSPVRASTAVRDARTEDVNANTRSGAPEDASIMVLVRADVIGKVLKAAA